jgi:hypothetical protein
MFRPADLLATPIAPTAVLPHWASRGFYVRAYHGSLPPRAPDMLTVRFGQLMVKGLSPLKIRSLVGCSPNDLAQPRPPQTLDRATTDPGRRCSALFGAITFLRLQNS